MENYSEFQKKFVNFFFFFNGFFCKLDKYPYTISLDEDFLISFKSPSVYYNFMKFLKSNDFKEKETPLEEFTSRLDNLG